MIRGVGVELIEIPRFEEEVRTGGERLLAETLVPEELAYCRSMRRPALPLAARVAAKRAFFTALGLSLEGPLPWLDLEILHGAGGAPTLAMRGEAARLASERGARRAHVSLSHTDAAAVAAVILED